ncbi:MAG: hypothetical protein AB8B46_01745 [Candidatus Midichloriaceae bacterium]
MHKLTTFVITFSIINLFVDFSFSGQNEQKNTIELKKQIDEMQQQQIDQLQQYVFNLQDLKDLPSAVTTFQNDELIEQIKSLRKEMEYVKKEMQSIKYDLNRTVQSINNKLDNLENEINEQSNNQQLLNLIDSQLDAPSNTNSAMNSKNKFEDANSFKKENAEYQNILKSLKNKDFDVSILKFKKFLKTYPNSILNSNVYFYLGEINYQRKNYTSAAVSYLKGFQFGQGTRTLSNLTMLAKSLANIGSYEKACKVIHYTYTNYSEKPFLIKQTLNEVENTAKCKQYVN